MTGRWAGGMFENQVMMAQWEAGLQLAGARRRTSVSLCALSQRQCREVCVIHSS